MCNKHDWYRLTRNCRLTHTPSSFTSVEYRTKWSKESAVCYTLPWFIWSSPFSLFSLDKYYFFIPARSFVWFYAFLTSQIASIFITLLLSSLMMMYRFFVWFSMDGVFLILHWGLFRLNFSQKLFSWNFPSIEFNQDFINQHFIIKS